MQGIPQKEKDDPVVLAVGTQVSAKYKGAFCEAKVRTIVKNIKVRVSYKKGGTGNITDDEIIGEIRVGNVVEVREPDKKESQEATITKIQDCSQYTVVFDDGDITTLRRSALCRQSGKHFNACDTLDQLPLTHPEHRGNTSKRSKTQDEWSDEDEEYAIGKVICVENTDTKKKNARESYFPALVVAPKAQETAKIHIKTEYLVRSFKDGRYYTVPKKEVTEFSNDTAQKSDLVAVSAAREYLDKNVLPAHWDREVLIDSACLSEQELSDSSDDEPNEVKDRFFAQLLEFMEKRNSPLNKGPSITNRDVDLYRLYYSVEKFGGYANVTKIHNWKAIAKRLGFMPTDAIVKLVKHSYRKFLLAFEEAVSKGIEELPPRTNRDKARSSSTRSGSVASPKVPESSKSSKKSIDKPSTSSIADDSENTSESIKLTSTRKLSTASNKVKAAVEKIEKAEKIEKPFEKIAETSPKEVVERIKKEEKPVVVKDEEPTPSTSPVPSITKKEKFKKKPVEVKKKKEEVTEKKEVAVSASKVAHSGPIIPDDVPIEVDDRLKVYYRGSSDYEAKVLEISAQDGKPIYRVHYKGWNARYDEWIHRESIAENLTKDEPKKKSGSAASKSSTPSAGGSSSNLTTPTSKNAKRARNRADTTASSRSTTPLSNTSGKGKTAQKRVTRGAPANKTPRRTSSLNDDNSSESDEPIKKPVSKDDKKDDAKSSSGVRKSASSDLNEIRSELKKEAKTGEKEEGGSKSDDEKSTKSSIKSGKSPFDVKAKLKNLQRDSSRSSFHSTDSDSSHSVPSDVPNSSKSAYTSDNESNGPDKLPPAVVAKVEAKKSSFRFDDDSSEVKAGVASFFDKMGEKAEVKPGDATIFTSKKPNIFQEKKLTQQRAMTSAAADTKVGRFGQIDKSIAKEAGKGKPKEGKPVEKSAESDVYDFKDEEFSDTKATSPTKKQETPPEGLTKKQQLAQNRKQARLLKEAQDVAAATSGSPMEDIESMIKTSIVQSNKKRKKSPSKEEKSQQSMIVARTPANPPQPSPVQPAAGNYSGWTPVRDNYPKPGGSSMPPKGRNDSTFDVLRKSPNFNMHVGDDFPIAKPQVFPSAGQKAASKALFGSQEMEPHDLLKPIMVPTNEDEKPELEAFKKILEPSFDALPKAEKSTSIADKLLKSMNKEAEMSHQASVITKKEEVKVEPKGDPYMFKAKSPVSQLGAGKKPLLVSSDIKTDEKTKSNVELQGIIQKLESAIQRSATPIGGLDLASSDVSSHFAAIKKQADDSDTDSDPRLVIEDEVETVEKKKSLLESMMHDEVQYKHGSSSSHKEEAEKKAESGEQQSETMSLLLCEETIPGSPAPVPVKDPLSEIGRSPSSTSGGFVHPPSMPSQSSNYMKYPGSITTALLHQQYQSSASHQTNLKQIPMDIDTDVHEAATGDILRDKLKSERGSATSSGNNTNNNSDNSPRDSNDDQSESEKNVNKSDVTPKKRKRGMKPEPDSNQKRRRPQPTRNANVRGNLQGNDSGSDDNSDVNAFTSSRSQSETGCVSSGGKMQFNFLVELDPNMSSNQRINILVKKIQELKKTYLMIKNEMNAKDRRRKKLRRRERENKQKQIPKVA